MSTMIKGTFFFALAITMFAYPHEVVSAAARGLALWWNYVVPALLPFFILAELLMAIGFVHFMGVVFEPMMRPLFRLPGQAAFIFALSFTSGIPSGAVLTSKMRRENMLTQIEGERLLAFTCNPSPGFMFGAVAAGMMKRPELGIVLAGSVYLANFLVGLLFRFYGKAPSQPPLTSTPSLKRAFSEMHKAQAQCPRPLGLLLGDAIRQSINTMLLIGGFILSFTILVSMLNLLNVTTFLGTLVQHLSNGLISPQEFSALLNGLLETTLGCRTALESFTTIHVQVGVISFIMGWGGLSAFAQVASFTGMTDLRLTPFVVGRALQALFATAISQFLMHYYQIPVYNPANSLMEYGFWDSWRLSASVLIIFILIILGVVILQWLKDGLPRSRS